MAAIDSLLKLARQQGADELRLAVGEAPQMFARGAPTRLSVPATSEATLRVLLDAILTPALEQELNARGTSETTYVAPTLGTYRVTFRAREGGGFTVTVSDAASTPAPASPVEPPPRSAAEPAPVARVGARAARPSGKLTEWLQQAVTASASDLHLAEGDHPYLRIDGVLERLSAEIIHDLNAVLPLEASQAERLARGESIDTAIDIATVGRVRVHVYRTESGPVAALRLLVRAAPRFSSLNMPAAFDDLIDLPHGLVLVCGAAGAGKSTTLAALAQEALYRRSIVLVTLEDPIEYVLQPGPASLVRRRQLGRDVGGFAAGLRDALRADPDVLLIGEIRDAETTALALTAAETGHLVLASLHSRSAASAIDRLVDASPPEQQQQVRIQLAESLRAVVSQRLLRRRQGQGRLPAIELLRVNRAIASLIREGKSAQIGSVLQSSHREGMLVLERSLADRVQAGEIELEDAYAAANDAEVLSILLKR
ncbi:MAG TPA: PilT/PilU family type 4a pilus ATPase [Polyangiales bacterium]|nr:PilT/PilU family type 4a pilus ATPase [Polyangiales bacterium]